MSSLPDELIERLREKLGAHAVNKDNEWQYTVEMEGFLLMVHHLEDAEQILLSTCVAPLARESREELCLTLLKGQYFFQHTAGATLAVDGEASFIVLQAVYSLRLLTADSFILTVERFMQAAEYWRGKCTGALENAPEDAAVSQALLNGGLRV